MADLLQDALAEFEQVTTFKPLLTPEYRSVLNGLCEFLKEKPLRPRKERARWLLAHINRKFRLNRLPIASVYREAAESGTTFNYHEKEAIQQAFDLSDGAAFARVLKEKGVARLLHNRLIELFQPIGRDLTIKTLSSEVANPSKLRIEKGERQIGRDILLSTLSSFMFSLAEEEILHSYFDDSYSSEQYETSFWIQLRKNHPELYDRHCTLDIIRVDDTFSSGYHDYESLLCALMEIVRSSYDKLSNHGYLALWIYPLRNVGEIVTWQLVESIKLFAEKFLESFFETPVFRLQADYRRNYLIHSQCGCR